MKNINLLLSLIVFTIFAGCATTYSGQKILPVKKYHDIMKGEKLPPVNVNYKKYTRQSSDYSIADANEAAELFHESEIFSRIGFGEDNEPIQMHVSYRQIGNDNYAQGIFIGLTLGMIPQKVKYTIMLGIEVFVNNQKISTHKYELEKVVQGSIFDEDALNNMEKDALVILLDRFFVELLEDTELTGKLKKQGQKGVGTIQGFGDKTQSSSFGNNPLTA